MSVRGSAMAAALLCLGLLFVSAAGSMAEMWVIGENNTILCYNGIQWKAVTGVPAGDYKGIWGNSNTDIYIATGGNTLIHFDGSSWSVIPVGDPGEYEYGYYLVDVNGWGPYDIYAFGYWGNYNPYFGGNGGCVFHFNGAGWELHEDALGYNTRKGWASESGWLFSMGSYYDAVYNYSYDYTQYMSPEGVTSTIQDDTNQDHFHVWGLDNTNIYMSYSWWNPMFLGDGLINRFNGSSWSNLQFPDTTWNGTPENPVPTNWTYFHSYGFWGTAPDDMYFAGRDGRMLHYGGSWQEWTELKTRTTEHLRSVYGLSSNDVFAVGDAGTIIHYDGAGCTKQNIGTNENLIEIWGAPEEPVATLLQSFDLRLDAESVTLRWELSSYEDGDRFVVTRRDLSGGAAVLGEESIERDGLIFTCVDGDLRPGTTYVYSVDLVSGGSRTYLFETEAVSVPKAEIALDQNYPNPFNPYTTIRYMVPSDGAVTLTIYDAAGREVVRLVDGVKEAGWHTAEWDGIDSKGNAVSSGIYFYRLEAGRERVERKMVMLR